MRKQGQGQRIVEANSHEQGSLEKKKKQTVIHAVVHKQERHVDKPVTLAAEPTALMLRGWLGSEGKPRQLGWPSQPFAAPPVSDQQ